MAAVGMFTLVSMTKAQYLSKNQLLPTGVETWKRYEISFSKKYAIAVIDRFVAGENIDKVFKTSLRNLLEILTPKENEKIKLAGIRLDGGKNSLNMMRK